ncbi:protein kinase [Streptomyces sp. NPDC001985]|uniref:serine/threonine-protein kinase n=1 Tax=Streptomyces sp. NPDC001985 TaxID=3154406 RepID=UPI003324E04E
MSSGESGEQRVIDGRFALEARLGGGGMGTVWRARDLLLDRAVALKEVRPPDPALAEYDPEAARVLRARVLREARALARVDHPNVVTIHHVVDGGEDTCPWLVMELVTGGSLHDRLARGPVEPAAAAVLGREVLAALRAAHGAGIQHRDVKPANVLLRPDGRPVLTDFGIAAIRESTALTATGAMIGTPDYMAPERITGEAGGPASDLWSLAMMLYVAVEGRHPLRRATTLATLAAVLSEEVPPPRGAGPLTGVLTALLVRDPAARPAPETVDRMLAAAAEPVRGAPEETRGSGGGETSYRLTPPSRPVPGDAPVPGRGSGERGPRAVRRTAVAGALAGTVLTGVLVWALLPGPDRDNSPPAAAPSGTSASASATPSRPPAPSSGAPGTAPAPKEKAEKAETEEKRRSPEAPGTRESPGLLTPIAIRAAIGEITAETGTDRVGSLSVHPEHISLDSMVPGSDKKYDMYIYRVGQGVSRSPVSGTLSGGRQPVDLDDFDWSAVPALLERADRELGVEEPTSRYLLAEGANDIFGTPPGLTVHLSDRYHSGGYLQADRRGRVTKVSPAES